MEEIEYQLRQLRQENEELRIQLQDARITLDAIRNGEVDAFIVDGLCGKQIFSLQGADYSYRVLIEEMQEGAITLSEDGSILYANRFMERILETKLEKFIGRAIEPFVYPSDLPAFQAIVKQSMHGHESSEIRLVTSSGVAIPTYLSASSVLIGDVPVLCLTLTDLTHQKRHERIMAEERLSRSIIDQSADAIIVFDDRGIIIRASQAGFDLIGNNCLNVHFNDAFRLYLKQSGKELSGRNPESGLFTIDSVIAGGKIHSREVFIEKENVPAKHLILSATPMVDNSNRVVGGIINLTDITEKAETERQLKESREWLDITLKSIGDGIIATDEHGSILFMNQVAEKLTGWNMADALGKPVDEIFRIINEETQEAAINPVTKVLDEGIVVITTNNTFLVTKDGREFPIKESAAPINISVDRRIGVVLVFQDDSENRRMAAQLHQSQKMESIGRLAGGIAHDFNNMMMVILGYTELSLDSLDSSEPLYENLKEIRNSAKRSADLTRQLLAFARKQSIAPIVLDINLIVGGMLKLLERLVGENIKLHWQQGKDLWQVKADPSQIDQILANLCVNARDAIAGIGNVLIATGNVTCDKVYCSSYPYAVPGDYVLLTVSDDGCGMEKEILANLFEPFFTTKEFGKGTGLGLATVYGIVKQNNGFIDVHSEPGKGTTFRIYLPRHMENVPQIEKQDRKESCHGHETILLVEDEPAILKMGKIMLESLGYKVLTANSPIKAINIAKDHVGGIDLLITDVIMPEMHGRDLAQTIQTLYPAIKCMFMSGYTADVIARDGLIDEGTHFVQKPFSRNELSEKVRKALVSS